MVLRLEAKKRTQRAFRGAYVLKEAQLRANGLTLGPVGARIVGEVIIGLLEHDHDPYLSVLPLWRPTLPTFAGRRHRGVPHD